VTDPLDKWRWLPRDSPETPSAAEWSVLKTRYYQAEREAFARADRLGAKWRAQRELAA
jgi:hypothetical protein